MAKKRPTPRAASVDRAYKRLDQKYARWRKRMKNPDSQILLDALQGVEVYLLGDTLMRQDFEEEISAEVEHLSDKIDELEPQSMV